MNTYSKFIFKNFDFDSSKKRLTLTYALDDILVFNEIYSFNFPFVNYDREQLQRAMQNLHIMAGVSYFKAYLPPNIEVSYTSLDATSAHFFSETYASGLGEFFYVNNLDPNTKITFPADTTEYQMHESTVTEGLLVGLGGGKDSLVSVELLRSHSRVATWSLGHENKLRPLVDVVGLPHFYVTRKLDPHLIKLNAEGALNGHVPISAIFACVGTVVGILAGYKSHVVSNENSANEASLEYRGRSINHQYSKSLAFETSYQAQLQYDFGNAVEYYSLLRPLSELRIAELFASLGFEKYHSVFSSCNQAYTAQYNELFWCGKCAKCAFVFLALTPFIERTSLEMLWAGKNLLLDSELVITYNNLLGIDGEKPLDCVGEVQESRSAMRLAQALYPELSKYEFYLDETYDYKTLYPHNIPASVYAELLPQFA